jgi:hypothetical protein
MMDSVKIRQRERKKQGAEKEEMETVCCSKIMRFQGSETWSPPFHFM